MKVEVELMQAGIPWQAIQEMPPERVYLYRAFLIAMAEQIKEDRNLASLGGGQR